jgi:hypothetical protein
VLIRADRTGLEPATSAVTGRHSNQLNYRSILLFYICLRGQILLSQERYIYFVIPLGFPVFQRDKLLIPEKIYTCATHIFCDPAGIRTQDHYIKSVMLYQLSYGIILFRFAETVFLKSEANIRQ